MTKPAAAAGSGVTITESFNTADSDTLGPDLVWTETLADLDIVTNQAKATTAAGEARAESDLSTSNHYAQAACFKNGTGDGAQGLTVCVRFAAAARTYYGLRVEANNGYTISKRVAGTNTSLKTGALTWVNGDIIRLEVTGTTLNALKNGVQFDTHTDASIAGGTRCGILVTGATVSLDTFQAGDL